MNPPPGGATVELYVMLGELKCPEEEQRNVFYSRIIFFREFIIVNLSSPLNSLQKKQFRNLPL